MTSKEALKNICSKCEEEKWENKIRCPFRSISSDYCEEYETIEKDLEILEILKKHYDKNSQTMSLDRFISFIIYNDDENYEKIKEWLEQ